jgi:WD40 repeat protein
MRSVTFSPDGQSIACATPSTVSLWVVATGDLLSSIVHDPFPEGGPVSFSPDGALVAGSPGDGTISLWDVATGTRLRSFEVQAADVSAVAFSPDGELIASGSVDGTIELWEIATSTLISICSIHSSIGKGGVLSVTFSPAGELVASGSRDGTIRIWSTATGEQLSSAVDTGARASAVDIGTWVNSIAFSPDGRILASGSWDSTIRLWNVTSSAP